LCHHLKMRDLNFGDIPLRFFSDFYPFFLFNTSERAREGSEV